MRERDVGVLIIGYPKGISRNRGNKLTASFWNYGYTIKSFEEVGEEMGIKVTKEDEEWSSKKCPLCGEAHENGRIKRGPYRYPRIGKIINADLNGARNIPHIPESPGSGGGGKPPARDRGNGLKTQPAVYRWTNGAGWVSTPTSYEVMRMKAVNRKPMNRPEGTLAPRAGRRSER